MVSGFQNGFSYKDFKSGSVSSDELLRLINVTYDFRDEPHKNPLYYVDKELRKSRSSLLDVAVILFNREYDIFPNNDDLNKKINLFKYLMKCKFSNILLLLAEYQVQFRAKQLQLAALEQKSKYYSELHDERLAREQTERCNHILMQQEKEIQRLREEMRAYLDKLDQEIAMRERFITAARVQCARNIIDNADKIIINGRKFFEGMPKEQIEYFVNRHLEIVENKERKFIELQVSRDQALERVDMEHSRFNGAQHAFKVDKKKRIHEGFERSVAVLNQEYAADIESLAHESGRKVEDIIAYENHTFVKEEIDHYKNCTQQERVGIVMAVKQKEAIYNFDKVLTEANIDSKDAANRKGEEIALTHETEAVVVESKDKAVDVKVEGVITRGNVDVYDRNIGIGMSKILNTLVDIPLSIHEGNELDAVFSPVGEWSLVDLDDLDEIDDLDELASIDDVISSVAQNLKSALPEESMPSEGLKMSNR